MYYFKDIHTIIGGELVQPCPDTFINYLITDSRNISFPENSVFFALKAHKDGHLFMGDAFQKGVRHFIVSEPTDITLFPGAAFIHVTDTLSALQQLAAAHRRKFHYPVIGITGSNGKTIVKEWLYELLKEKYSIVRSPRSYNSQIGVPLSVWQMGTENTLAIFEAGISKLGEMDALEQIIHPDIVLLTNLGEAHNDGFQSKEEKAKEKLILAKRASLIIYRKASFGQWLDKEEKKDGITERLSWDFEEGADVHVQLHKHITHCELKLSYKNNHHYVELPFIDDASIENAVHCCCVLIYLGLSNPPMLDRFKTLHTIDMRLQLKHAINYCLLVNDSYSADLTSFKTAIDFMQQQSAGLKKTAILSDFFGSNNEDLLYTTIADLLLSGGIKKVIAIGERITHHFQQKLHKSITLLTFASVDDFLLEFKSSSFNQEIILLKGARSFAFERIAQVFDEKVHQTILEVDLNALAHNLKEYQKVLRPGVKMMAMVKAFSYGSGGAEIAGILQFHKIDFLGVAYVDEGVELRKNGITTPIMVMNADESSFSALIDYNLQPVLYSLDFLKRFQSFLAAQALHYYPVHLELETGMNRLGFSENEIRELVPLLTTGTFLKIESVFSHLAASEDPGQDEFTKQQGLLFIQMTAALQKVINYSFLKHLANSAAIIRHPDLQFDMVRLGIGLYGIEAVTHQLALEPVASLKASIAQLKQVKKGDSVSYNRRGVLYRDSQIATVRIGYADGYNRRFGNGIGQVYLRGQRVPVIGTVCMDMTMIDVTDVADVQVGDMVEIFGKNVPVTEMAGWIGTIPYEIMTAVSQRVKRLYYQE